MPSLRLNPLAPGHTLVVPTTHFIDVFDTPPDVLTTSMMLVQRVAAAMQSLQYPDDGRLRPAKRLTGALSVTRAR